MKKQTFSLMVLGVLAAFVVASSLIAFKNNAIQTAAYSYSDETIRTYMTPDDSQDSFTQYGAFTMYAYGYDDSGNNTAGAYPGKAMTKLLAEYKHDNTTNYGNDLYYVDLPSTTTKVIFTNDMPFYGAAKETAGLSLTANIDVKVYAIVGNVYGGADDGKQFGFWQDLNLTTSEFGQIIDGIDTCSASSTTGYNAVPYLDYYYASHATINNTINLNEPGYGDNAGSTIQVGVLDKWNGLLNMYDANNGSEPLATATDNIGNEKSLGFMIIISIITMSVCYVYFRYRKPRTTIEK